MSVEPCFGDQGIPKPSISVVVPCYNAAQTILGTLASVRAQGQWVTEVLVVDDGSSDGSAEIVQLRCPGVRVVRQRNAGVAAARNRGMAEARSDWVAFIDADDLWLPGKLEAQCRALAAAPEVRLSYTAWAAWPSDADAPDPRWLDELQRRADDPDAWSGASGWIYTNLLFSCCVWTSTVLGQRSLFLELDGFDPSLRVGEDYDLWLRAARITPIHRVDRPYALYRQHAQSLTRRVHTVNYEGRVVENALARWGLTGPDGRQADADEVRRRVARTWVNFAEAHLCAGHRAEARNAARAAIGRDPFCGAGWRLLLQSMLRAPVRGES